MISFIVIYAIVGFILGEIVNVMVYKIENNIKAFSKMRCASCSSNGSFIDNYCPILSCIIHKGKRNCCGEKIQLKRVFTPFVCAILSGTSYLVFGKEYFIYSIILAIMCVAQIAIIEIDFDTCIIPDRFQITILILGSLTFIFKNPMTWYDRLIGAFAGGGLFLLIYFISKLILKREGLGFGDVKLVFVSGFFTGWKGMIFSILVASVIGSIVLLIIKKVKNADRYQEFAFAPFLSSAFILSSFVGNYLVDLYISIL